MTDWNHLERHDRIQRLQNKYSQWQEDSPKSTVIGLVALFIAAAICIYVVLCFEPEIDRIGIAPNHTTIILHEQSRGER